MADWNGQENDCIFRLYISEETSCHGLRIAEAEKVNDSLSELPADANYIISSQTTAAVCTFWIVDVVLRRTENRRSFVRPPRDGFWCRRLRRRSERKKATPGGVRFPPPTIW